MAGPRRAPSCPKCGHVLDEPREHADGLPGIKYRECQGCGYVVADVVRRTRREKLPD